MISAEEARELIKSSSKLADIESRIKSAAISGRTYIEVRILSDVLKKHLISLGYKVKEAKDWRVDVYNERYTVDIHRISWGEENE